MSRFYIEDVCTVPGTLGQLRAVEGAKVYLFAAGSGTTHTEPAIPTGTAVTGNFYNADSGGSQLNATHAWGPLTTDADGHWEAYFDTVQRVDVVYSSNNGTATIVGTSQTVAFDQFKDVQGMTSGVPGVGGTTTVAVQDSVGTPLGNMDTLKVVGGDVDFSSSTAVLNLLGGFSRDFVILQELDGTFSAKRKDHDQHLYNAADWGTVVNSVDAALTAAATLGASTAYAGSFTTAVAITINADGHHIYGPGFGEDGDELPGQIKLSGISSPYVGGLGDTPWFTINGNSCGIHNVDFNANLLAKTAFYIAPTSGGNIHGRNFQYEGSAVSGGCAYVVDWEGDDGFIGGLSRIKMDVGGDGTHGVAAWLMNGADINASNTHVHGGGVGATGRVLVNSGQTSKFVGVHIESGNANTNGWVVEAGAEKSYFVGCTFGHQEAGGEVLVTSNSTFHSVGCLYHPDTDLNATNTYDMVKLNSASSKTVFVGNDAFIANAANNWRYAFNNNGPTTLAQVFSNRLRAVTGTFSSLSGVQQFGNSLEGAMVPGNVSTYGSSVNTLTDAATVSVDLSLGDLQYLTNSGTARTFGSPSNVTKGKWTFVITNSGASAVTHNWNTKYKMRAGTGPTVAGGSTQSITFFSHDGTNLYELGRTDGDI